MPGGEIAAPRWHTYSIADPKGRITFWGEIDRQHVLPSPDPEKGRAAARRVFERLHDPTGGLIGQFEFGPGAHPETVLAILEEWDRLDRQARA